jgi:hypothetical protein
MRLRRALSTEWFSFPKTQNEKILRLAILALVAYRDIGTGQRDERNEREASGFVTAIG